MKIYIRVVTVALVSFVTCSHYRMYGYNTSVVSSSTQGTQARAIVVRAVASSNNATKKRMTVLHADGTELVIQPDGNHKHSYKLSANMTVNVAHGTYVIKLPEGAAAMNQSEIVVGAVYSGAQKYPRTLIIETAGKELALIRVQDPNDHLLVEIQRDNFRPYAPPVSERMINKDSRLHVVALEGGVAQKMIYSR